MLKPLFDIFTSSLSPCIYGLENFVLMFILKIVEVSTALRVEAVQLAIWKCHYCSNIHKNKQRANKSNLQQKLKNKLWFKKDNDNFAIGLTQDLISYTSLESVAPTYFSSQFEKKPKNPSYPKYYLNCIPPKILKGCNHEDITPEFPLFNRSKCKVLTIQISFF